MSGGEVIRPDKETGLKKIHNLPIEWLGDRLIMLDQTRLPRQEVYLELDDYQSVAAAIKELKVRGGTGHRCRRGLCHCSGRSEN